MTEIVLFGGKGIALVDDDQFERIAAHSWHLRPTGKGRVYATTKLLINGSFRSVQMHRFICNAPASMDVDHIDNNTLNNQLANLRVASRSQNLANRGAKPGCKSRFKGVYLNGRRWSARIQYHGVVHCLGSYATEEAAAMAYDSAARQIHGEFARMNFPINDERAA